MKKITMLMGVLASIFFLTACTCKSPCAYKDAPCNATHQDLKGER